MHVYAVAAATHALEEVEPAGAVWPLGHAVHEVAEPPTEYEFAAHTTHEDPLRYEPAEHVAAVAHDAGERQWPVEEHTEFDAHVWQKAVLPVL